MAGELVFNEAVKAKEWSIPLLHKLVDQPDTLSYFVAGANKGHKRSLNRIGKLMIREIGTDWQLDYVDIHEGGGTIYWRRHE